MKNITLSVDEKVLEAVRRFASERNTTVNALVRQHLERIAKNENRLAEAIARMRQMSETSTARIGPKTWTRDGLHER
jgi:hypothetical protein